MSSSVNKRGSAVDLTEDVSVSAPLKIHEKSIDTVAKELQTDLAKGISSAEAAARFEKYGPNELEQPPRISLLMLFKSIYTSN